MFLNWSGRYFAGWSRIQVYTLCACCFSYGKGWHDQSQDKKYKAPCETGVHFRWLRWRTGKQNIETLFFFCKRVMHCSLKRNLIGFNCFFIDLIVPTILELRQRCCGFEWSSTQCLTWNSSGESHCMYRQHSSLFNNFKLHLI